MGICAKFIERGGVDILGIYNTGYFRMQGYGSLAGMLPIADANELVFQTARREVLPQVRNTPVVAGVNGVDPLRDMRLFLEDLRRIGISGVRLEAKVHIVTGAVTSAQNISKCVQGCGLQVTRLTLEQLASSYAVLTSDEKQLGICLVDMGGGTSDIAVFAGGAIRHTAVLPIAGDQVTNDIAVALRTPTQYAEEIKIKYACALAQLASADETIEVPSVGDRPPRRLARHTLAEVVKAREFLEELLDARGQVRDGATAAGKPAEGGLEPFLGEPRFDVQRIFTGERFPNVVVAVDGTVLATWGNQAIRVRRSEDGGETWGPEIRRYYWELCRRMGLCE